MTYNIYYGTIGKTLGVKYRFTKNAKNESEAKKLAKNSALNFYYKNEGKFGIPSFADIDHESKLTGIGIEVLYDDHVNDMMRWYVIPTHLDTVPDNKLRF